MSASLASLGNWYPVLSPTPHPPHPPGQVKADTKVSHEHNVSSCVFNKGANHQTIKITHHSDQGFQRQIKIKNWKVISSLSRTPSYSNRAKLYPLSSPPLPPHKLAAQADKLSHIPTLTAPLNAQQKGSNKEKTPHNTHKPWNYSLYWHPSQSLVVITLGLPQLRCKFYTTVFSFFRIHLFIFGHTALWGSPSLQMSQ